MGAVVTRGRLHLRPVAESLDDTDFSIEIEMGREDGVLTFGDLRRAAQKYGAHGHHEIAHRIWLGLVTAAAELPDASGLLEQVEERAHAAILRAGSDVSEKFRQSGVKFDYRKIADERLSGMSVADVALVNGCSSSTVARAVEFVAEHDALLERHPNFFQQLTAHANPDELAAAYGVEAKIMRWIVATNFDRRR